MLKKIKHKGFLGALSGLLVLWLVVQINHEKLSPDQIQSEQIQNYDLILVRGISWQSQILRLNKIFGESYSHVGILVKEDSGVYVLHATPDGQPHNGIRFDSLEKFLNLSVVTSIAMLRLNGSSLNSTETIAKRVAWYREQSIPFDYKFNTSDSSELYCSELVLRIFEGLVNVRLDEPVHPNRFLRMKAFRKLSAISSE
ncbi:MAG: YiiX/YebB-like N1pC/P60 family cysteine hydrolase [Bacteroidota bacterium]